MKTALTLAGFTVTWPGFQLGPLRFAVAPGERVAVVGANGAGKSTALRCIAGRLDGYEGSVKVHGTEVREDRRGTRTRVGVLPERLLGFRWMTAAQHLELLSGFHATWDPAYAAALCRTLDVPMDTPLGHLSRGNKVKLSFVAAEAFRPPVLLLDEPTSGVDPVMRDHLLAAVDACVPAGGDRTLVFSTHILEDIEPLAQRILLLREGALVGDHTVRELKDHAPGQSLSTLLRRRLSHA